MTQLLLGFALAVIIAFLAYRAHSLSRAGAYAAFFLGTIIFGLGGWEWGVLLLTFFITSSALSHAFKKNKRGLHEKYSKGDQRDAGQVFANGGIPAIFALLHFFQPDETWLWVAFASSLAAANADTWATEVGVLNPSQPRLITKLGMRVEKGTSGAISWTGTLASLAGAALIGLLASFTGLEPASASTVMIVTLAGFAAALFDSFLGATVQAMYFCPKDNKETEQHPIHSCGTPTTRIRGWAWLNNDWVNVACGIFAVLMTLLLSRII
jgi:uncharacterized protein (TIGR00297 family)